MCITLHVTDVMCDRFPLGISWMSSLIETLICQNFYILLLTKRQGL